MGDGFSHPHSLLVVHNITVHSLHESSLRETCDNSVARGDSNDMAIATRSPKPRNCKSAHCNRQYSNRQCFDVKILWKFIVYHEHS